jgi:branched-subunit amino acid aminotransferase/4-amino-4-deoxychorismate lyase
MPLLSANPVDSLWWASEKLRTRIIAEPEAVLKDRGLTPPPEMSAATLLEYIQLTHLLWIDSKLVSIEDFRIDPADEGLLLGKGVWESTKTMNHVPWLWTMHCERMVQSAKVLGIKLDAEQLPATEQVTEYAKALTQDDVLIRLNATAGRPGGPGLVWMSASPLPRYPDEVRLRTVKNPVRKGQPYLLLKTFNYAARLQVGQAATLDGYDSALMLDDDDNMLEAAHANIFVRYPDGWATPVPDGGFLPGTLRQVIQDRGPMPVSAKVLHVSTLATAQEVFVTNSNAGIVPVTQIDGYRFRVGPETLALQAWLNSAGVSRSRYVFSAPARPA